MKYLLITTVNPAIWESLSEEKRDEVLAAHGRFRTGIAEPGELCGSVTLADPSNSRTVRVRDGEATVTEGPYVEADEFVGGYYLVECETLERATELAAAVPDARYSAVEVRPLMHFAGMEM